MRGDRVGIAWGQLVVDTLTWGWKKPKIFLRGDAWANAWGGYAWVNETGVFE